MSTTQGIVSRIEHQTYSHSGNFLLAIQLDAAVNLGNSGGPVMEEDRLIGVVKIFARTGVFTLSGLGGLYVLAHMLEAPLGNVKLAAARMLGIFSAAGLLTWFNLSSDVMEWTIEAIGQAVVFVALSMLLFKLSVRDGATLLGITVFAVVGMVLVSSLVIWAAIPG